MISGCGPAQTYNAKFGFEVRALFGYCILKDATHTIRIGARRPIESVSQTRFSSFSKY